MKTIILLLLFLLPLYAMAETGTDSIDVARNSIFDPPQEEQVFFYHKDHLGSTLCITDRNGQIVERSEYIPYGEVFIDNLASDAEYETPYKFTGKEYDEETGLYYFGARYLHPKYATWLSVDPFAMKYPNVSPYTYCMGNPIKYVDPDGEEVVKGYGSDLWNKGLAILSNYLQMNDDPNSIMIIAHGVYKEGSDHAYAVNIKTFDEETKKWIDNKIVNGEQLDNLLSNISKTWNSYKKGEIDADNLHIVFYSCGTSDIVKKMSSYKAFENINFIAPNRKVCIGTDTMYIGSYSFNYLSGCNVTNDGENCGEWLKIKNGKYPAFFNSYKGNGNFPGTKGFKYSIL